MSPSSGGNNSARGALQKILFPAVAAALVALLFFVYGSVHREPEGAVPSQQQVFAQEKSAAKHAVELCRSRATALPAGSSEAKIAQDACQLMQAHYEQTYRLTP
ncbi:hypothetical protein [Janthinobacterium sp. AD80]|uniref:hypothetical protein n=1 Tax=Janthinobacterium sp. AD80 TaxID=1528773 RepID=UPI0011AEEE26|nr:hypothetical protein [Janthinobacterium sp. AD80]